MCFTWFEIYWTCPQGRYVLPLCLALWENTDAHEWSTCFYISVSLVASNSPVEIVACFFHSQSAFKPFSYFFHFLLHWLPTRWDHIWVSKSRRKHFFKKKKSAFQILIFFLNMSVPSPAHKLIWLLQWSGLLFWLSPFPIPSVIFCRGDPQQCDCRDGKVLRTEKHN